MAAFVDGLTAGPAALLVEGEAGIGKTTVWRAAVAAARQRGYRVAAATAVDDEVDLAFVVLRDLLEAMPAETGDALPPVQREALDIALLRSVHLATAADHHAVSAAVLGVVRAVAAKAPLVVAVDDAGWLDRSSERVLRYVIRRLTNESVGILAARRPGADHQLPLGLDRSPVRDRLRHLKLGPLDADALPTLLSEQAGLVLPRRIIRQLHRVCGGNPLYALEIARAVRRRGREALAEGSLPLPSTVVASTADRLVAMSPAAREVLAVAAEASLPSVTLVAAVTGEQAKDGVAEAVAEGLLEVDGERVRFTHPILRSAVAASLPGRRRRALHRQLAQLVDDPDQRAVHLAAGVSAPDETVALALEEAAHRAFVCGAPDTAAELAGRAVTLTPTGLTTAAARRKIMAAEYHLRVENPVAARVLLEEVIAEQPAGGTRAEALLWLALTTHSQNRLFETRPYLQQAITEATDDHIRAAAQRLLALHLVATNEPASAGPHAAEALRTAQASGDPTSVAESQKVLAWTQFWVGDALSIDLVAAAQDQRWTRYTLREMRAGMTGLMLSWSDQVELAREVLRARVRDAREYGDDRALAMLMWNLSELECWAGRWDLALDHVAEGWRAVALTDSDVIRCLLLAVRGLISAHQGRLDEARTDAERGLKISETSGITMAMRNHLTLLGFVELSAGDHAAVHRLLAPLAASVPSGEFEPSLMRFLPDEVEALVALGELDRAEKLLVRFETQAIRLDRPWGLLAGGRARALLAAANGDVDAAGAAVDAALAGERLEMPFERARTLLVAGSIRRRARRRREAREILTAALAEFDRLAAPLWAERTRAELKRIGGRTPSSGGLTETEQRIAELVQAGRTNREVATELCLAVSTVEAALWKIYRKLDVRSRTELAARLTPDNSGSLIVVPGGTLATVGHSLRSTSQTEFATRCPQRYE